MADKKHVDDSALEGIAGGAGKGAQTAYINKPAGKPAPTKPAASTKPLEVEIQKKPVGGTSSAKKSH